MDNIEICKDGFCTLEFHFCKVILTKSIAPQGFFYDLVSIHCKLCYRKFKASFFAGSDESWVSFEKKFEQKKLFQAEPIFCVTAFNFL
jgi:hypothetical protein